MLGSFAEGLALLRTINPAEADTFRVLVVQNLNGVAVKDPDRLRLDTQREQRQELGSRERGA